MGAEKSKTSLSLDHASSFVAENLPNSEYLVERHSIVKGEDFSEVLVTAQWLLEYGTISVDVVFSVSKGQADGMQNYLDDDEIKDDIDSGIGELFEEALREQYPSYDWGYSIGAVNLRCEVTE